MEKLKNFPDQLQLIEIINLTFLTYTKRKINDVVTVTDLPCA